MAKFISLKKWIINEGGAALAGSRDLSPKEVIETYDWVEKNILPLLKISKSDAIPIGSYGKKTNDQISSDIDIAISIDAILKANDDIVDILNFIAQILHEAGYPSKVIPGFNQISFAVPIQGSVRNGFAQVDFMLAKNLAWSKFMYHSPDYTKHESNYKGVIRTLLLMAILSESTRNILKITDDGQTEEVESKVIRLPDGIYSTRRTFIGKRGRIKKPKLMKEFDELITNDPVKATKLILGKNYKPKDLNSFETIWAIINKPDFIHKDHLNLIITKFKTGLLINNLETPQELKC